MKGYQHILCATDFSDHARAAAERAGEIRLHYGAQLTLLHIIEYFPEDRSNEEIASENIDPALFRERQARDSLMELAEHLGDDEIRQEVRFSTHSAKHELLRFAEQQAVDLIILASHGRHMITPIIGGTANGVVNGAPCDVLVVRAGTC